MRTKPSLTNESISRRFTNQFDLVNYTIQLTKEMIHSGRAPRVKLATDNPALQVLKEVDEGKDLFEESEREDQEEELLIESEEVPQEEASVES